MKKLFLLLSLAIIFKSNSQIITSTGTVSSLSVSPQVVCVCDSIKIKFRFTPSSSVDTLDKFNFYIDYFDYEYNATKYVKIRSFTFLDFYNMEKELINNINNDTAYSFWYKIPCDLINNIGKSGDSQVLIKITLKDGSGIAVLVKLCNLTGINSYEYDKKDVPVYYDMNRVIVAPKSGELLIRQIGINRVKVLIQ